MKFKILKYLLIFILLIGTTHFAKAQIVIHVKARPVIPPPPPPPPIPHPGYVWIGDEWTPHGSTYTVIRGHWIAPRRGRVWVPGHWATDRNGDYWIKGHWRRA